MGNVDRWVDVTVSVAVVGAVVRALSERSDRLVARLVAEARADTLTGLLNRRGFEERLAAEVARATRERTSLALVSLDLDHFKRVNDEQGHEAGDRALAMVGAVIADHVRGADLAARWGGEEFVVVLPGADAPAARAFAERVRAAVAASGTGLTASAASRSRGPPTRRAARRRGRRDVRGQAHGARPHRRRGRRRGRGRVTTGPVGYSPGGWRTT